jgi:large subunit ribosomal protein L4e
MKTQILNITGKKGKEIETGLFEEPIREDIIYKVVEAERLKQPYSPKYRAGMDRSASGNVRHKRHSWKSDRGRGLSRVPRKIFWRRGTQFSWQGAIIPSVKGGRRAHPPKGSVNLKKINKKELQKALLSALTYTSSVDEIKKKYKTLENEKIEIKLPLIVEDKILGLNTKDLFRFLEGILGNLYEVAIQKKAVRAGKGKSRGRKYKKNAGLLFVN